RPPCLLRGGAGLARAPGELAVQPDQRLEHLEREPAAGADLGQPELAVERAALRLGESDLELVAAAGRLGGEQRGDLDAERLRDRLQQAQTRLALAVLDQRQLRGRGADLGAEVLEGQTGSGAQVADLPSDGERGGHRFTLAKDRLIFPAIRDGMWLALQGQ